MMKQLWNFLCGAWIGVTLLNVFWDDFPTLRAMYLLFTAFSALFGLCCLLGDGYAPAWERWGVPKETRKKASAVMGGLFLIIAAVCPLGWLLARFVEFDTDFILLMQMGGFSAVCLLGCIPRFLTGKPCR